MEYLKQNLDNSLILPYDVMKTIYEYADSFAPIRRQIENKECNLDEIMYNRMKKFITSRYIIANHTYMLSNYDAGVVSTFVIGHYNIDDIELKDKILNWNHGYKDFFLWKSKNTPMLCGIETHYSPKTLTSEYFRYKMIEQLEITNTEYKHTYVLCMMSSTDIYDLWINM
jgi:hypothetical protein